MIEAPFAPLALPVPVVERRVINQRVYQDALDAGTSPLAARIIAARPLPSDIKIEHWLSPELKDLDSPKDMADLDKASKRLTQAILEREVIGIETDHDCDGQTSHAVLYLALTQWFNHPKDKVRSYIGHRMQEGYGLSEPLMQRILTDDVKPTLVITADNGSSDEERIKVLKENGVDVIVTDHHAIPETGIPKSAYAVLNPTREDCGYPDPLIAGCMVAWIFMAHQRSHLIREKHLPKTTPSLTKLLDFVAVGTVADCVSLSRSINNRIVTRYGMKVLSSFQRPCWRAIKNEVTDKITSEDIGFKIGPLLNSDGRLECAFSSVSFLLSESDSEALEWVVQLVETNQQRKAIQKEITDEATKQACQINLPNSKSLSIYLKDGHAGVHGISASRIRETFGKPCFLFSPKQNAPDLISGSGRSTDECHLRDALVVMSEQHPNLFVGFGGHHGAAGATIRLKDFKVFQKAFEQAVALQLKEPLYPVVLSDGPLGDQGVSLEEFQNLIDTLEPFGREFDAPMFEIEGDCSYFKWIGATKTHASFMLKTPAQTYPCVWFNARQDVETPVHFVEGDRIRVLFSFQIDTFRFPHKLKLFVRHVF